MCVAVRGWSERVHVKRRREDMTRAATVIQAGLLAIFYKMFDGIFTSVQVLNAG